MKRRTFLKLGLVAPTFLYIGCGRRTSDAKFTPATNTGFDYIEAEGSHYDIGYAIGKYCGDTIRAIMKDRAEWLDNILSIEESPSGREFSADMFDTLEATFPNFILELHGMAEGSGIDFRKIWAMSIKSELEAHGEENPGCSTIYYNKNGNNWLFHNEDGHDAYHRRMLVLRAKPPSGVSFYTLVYPGIIPGVGPSMNDRGIIQTTNFIGTTRPGRGIPRYFLGRAILEAKSLDEAVEFATMAPRAFPWHHNLASTKTGEYISVETLPEGEVGKSNPEDIYLHTNHAIHPRTTSYVHQDLEYKNSSSISRYRVLSKKIEDTGGEIAKPGVALDWLSSHESRPYSPCRHPEGDIMGRTLATAFFDIGNRTMMIYKGNPCEAVPNTAAREYKF
ncbi:MAG: C45 family autoproteolytic acyltransferase/hydrolase [Candidatus Kapaibacterium sp.]